MPGTCRILQSRNKRQYLLVFREDPADLVNPVQGTMHHTRWPRVEMGLVLLLLYLDFTAPFY